MRVRWTVLLALLLTAFMAIGEAHAQRRGGSFGGGGFRRRSSSRRSIGSSSRSGRRSGRSRSGRSSSGGSYGGGSTSGSWVTALILLGFVVFVVVSVFIKWVGGSPQLLYSLLNRFHQDDSSDPNAMYVSRVSLGIDWRARRALQDTLKRLAETGDTNSAQGLADSLREVAIALRRAELSWLYVSQETYGPLSPESAEQRFNQIALRARAKFQTETIRGAGGDVYQPQAPEMRAHKNEGEGTVVVHLVVGSHSALPTMQAPDAHHIRWALDNRAALPANQLAALEVIWSPSDENDRMSTAELEQNYDMLLIDPKSIAGRIFCSYCQGPFAMELLTCPHCGAPSAASQQNRVPRGAS